MWFRLCRRMIDPSLTIWWIGTRRCEGTTSIRACSQSFSLSLNLISLSSRWTRTVYRVSPCVKIRSSRGSFSTFPPTGMRQEFHRFQLEIRRNWLFHHFLSLNFGIEALAFFPMIHLQNCVWLRGWVRAALTLDIISQWRSLDYHQPKAQIDKWDQQLLFVMFACALVATLRPWQLSIARSWFLWENSHNASLGH